MTRDSANLREKNHKRLQAIIVVLFPLWFLLCGLWVEQFQLEIPYFVTEFMVTYSGGFVRRGILGQSFLILSDRFGLSPLHLILGARILIAVVYSATLAHLCYKNRRQLGPWGACLILSNPFMGLYLWFALGSVDLVFLLITIVHVAVAKIAGDRYLPAAIGLFGTAGLYLCLSHEAFLFLCLPVNVAITWRRLSRHRLLTTFAIYAIPGVACGASLWFRGTKDQVVAITRAWEWKGIHLTSPNAVDLLTGKAAGEMRYTLQLMTPTHLAIWAASVLLCLFPLFYLARKWLKSSLSADSDRRRLGAYVGIPCLCTLPLYPVGNDWHRWIALPVATGIVCLLAEGLNGSPFEFKPKSAPFTLLLVLLGLVVMPTSLYFPPQSLFGGPLVQTLHDIHQILKRS